MIEGQLGRRVWVVSYQFDNVEVGKHYRRGFDNWREAYDYAVKIETLKDLLNVARLGVRQ